MKYERLGLNSLRIGYCNIRGIRGSKLILEKITAGYDILLFQETKLKDFSDFEMENFFFPVEGVDSGLAYAVNKNTSVTVDLVDSTLWNTSDRQVQILSITDPSLREPLTAVNIYVRGGTASRSEHWDFLHDLCHNHSNILITGDFNARHQSWDMYG